MVDDNQDNKVLRPEFGKVKSIRPLIEKKDPFRVLQKRTEEQKKKIEEKRRQDNEQIIKNYNLKKPKPPSTNGNPSPTS